MNRTIQLNKAIRLLDKDRNDEAEALLQTILAESGAENDPLPYEQVACILEEYWFYQGDLQEAKNYSEKQAGLPYRQTGLPVGI